MSPSIAVHFLPSLTTPEELAEGTAVVIDILRASTTIVHALAAGATSVVPCLEVDDARRVARQLGDRAVLGGERGGLRIDGFQFGNSPAEFNAESISGKTLVFTTTNGTLAMQQCRLAKLVLIGAFVNFSAVVAAIPPRTPLHLLCAGTRGRITREDVLFAGAVVHKLTYSHGGECDVNDQARIARDAWLAVLSESGGSRSGSADFQPTSKDLAATLRHTQGGRNLIGIGLATDIDDAAQLDRFSLVPSLDVGRWEIGKKCNVR